MSIWEAIRSFTREIGQALFTLRGEFYKPKFYYRLFKDEPKSFMDSLGEQQKRYFNHTLRLTAVFGVLTFILFIGNLFSQGGEVVHDPVQTGVLIEQVAETAKMSKDTYNSLEQLKKINEALEKVSQAVENVDYMYRIAQQEQQAIRSISRTYDRMKDSGKFSARELSYLMTQFNAILRNVERLNSLAKTALQDGLLKMNDRERIETLKELEESVTAHRMEVDRMGFHYNSIMNRRIVVDAFAKSNL